MSASACPICWGDGKIDMRDSDAYMSEHFIGVPALGILVCDECEGTGIVSPERAGELRAIATAAVDQARAALRARGIEV